MVPNSVDVLVRDGGGGWLLHKGFGCCVWPSLETCMYTLFQTKICDFPFLISEVSAKSIPHFRTAKISTQLTDIYDRSYQEMASR